MPVTKVEEERNREIARLIEAGVTYTAVGYSFGITRRRVSQIAKSLGVKSKRARDAETLAAWESRRNMVAYIYRETHSFRAAALASGVDVAHARQILTRMGLHKPKPRKVWTDEKTSEVEKLRESGLSFGAISHQLGITRNAAIGRMWRVRQCQ